MIEALKRYGAVLVAPRALARSLAPDVGLRDGVWLTLAYLVADQVLPLAEGLAGLLAMQNFNGLLMLASTVGRGLLAPILTLLTAEVLLGGDRSYRRGLALVPLILVVAVANLLEQSGIQLPGPRYLPQMLGAAVGLNLVFIMRKEIVPSPPGDAGPEDAS